MAKRVSCNYCSHVDFITDKDSNGWEFLGYDDEAELWCCPNCADIPSDDLPFGGWAPNEADLLLFKPSNTRLQSDETVRVCSRCGTTNTKESVDCYQCGNRLAAKA